MGTCSGTSGQTRHSGSSTLGTLASKLLATVPGQQRLTWSNRSFPVVALVPRLRSWQGTARSSGAREVQCLANLLVRDIRSCIGNNLWLVAEISGKDPWMDGPDGLRLALQEAETVTVPDRGKWRVG